MSTQPLDRAESAGPVLAAVDMTKHYPASRGVRGLGPRPVVHAVDEVSVALHPGEIVAVVGESGSGKTTLGRLMSRLEVPTSGDLRLHGGPIPARGTRRLRPFRREVQVVFQDPYASLNSAHTVGYHLQRPLQLHGLASSTAEARRQAIEVLERVHLTPGDAYIDRYPQQLSGGQRQRVAIARALATRPQAIIADEPVASLDVSSRLSILNLFAEIARDGAAILYITHDIASARYFAHRTLVMYAGRVAEQGPSEELVSAPYHPYTRLLIDSAPDPDRRGTPEIEERTGAPPSLVRPPSGCRFHPRCPHAMDVCRREEPPMVDFEADRKAACWLYGDDKRPEDVRPTTSTTSTTTGDAR